MSSNPRPRPPPITDRSQTPPSARPSARAITLAWRALAPSLIAVALVAITGLLALVFVGGDGRAAWAAAIVAVASLAGAALVITGWNLVVAPGRRLRFRARVLAVGHERAVRSRAPQDELADLERSLARLADRLARQDAAIERERRTLTALIESQDEPLLTLRADGSVLMGNDAARRFLRVGRGELIGRTIRELVTSASLLSLTDAAFKGQTRSATVAIPSDLGERTYSAFAAPLPMLDDDRPGVVLTLRDITELADAVRVKSDFVANASHELRTPLTAIRGAVETLSAAIAKNPDVAARLIEIIGGHVDRLDALVRDLLDLSRVESPDAPIRIEPLDPGLLERSLRDEFASALERRSLRLNCDLDAALDGWRTDPRLLVLALRNLVENATKFANEGSEIVLWSRVDRAAGAVRFEVRDEGLGIPLAQQQRVFERFYQVDPTRSGLDRDGDRRGTGLGLAIVRHAVRSLGGRVGLQSVYKRGTTVWLEIPLDPPSNRK